MARAHRYYILQMTPFVEITNALFLGVSAGVASPGGSMRHHPHLPSCIVLIPRDRSAPIATAAGGRGGGGGSSAELPLPLPPTQVDPPHCTPIIVRDTSPVHVFHFGNAYEDAAGLVHFTAVCLSPPFNMTWDHHVWLSNFTKAPGRLCAYTVDPGALSLEREQIDASACEFPATNPWRHGSQERYVYLMANDRGEQRLPFRDIVKCDVQHQGGRQVWRSHGLVSEPVFVPAGRDGADDDGWLLVQLYLPQAHKTEIAVLDARHVDAGPVCRLRLRHHMPFPFHCTYTSELIGIGGHVHSSSDARASANASRVRHAPSEAPHARL